MEPDLTKIIQRALEYRTYCLEAANTTSVRTVADLMLQCAEYREMFAAIAKRGHEARVSSRALLHDTDATFSSPTTRSMEEVWGITAGATVSN
jgi:hypothetical protein